MITPDEIKAKAQRKYLSVLRGLLSGAPFDPLLIRANKTYNKASLQDFEKEVLLLLSQSREKRGFGYSLKFQKVKTKHLGTQDLPTQIFFETESDFFRFLGKTAESDACKADAANIFSAFSQLKPWLTQHPARIIQYAGQWHDLLLVCQYFIDHPIPNLYIRELPIQVHTKFVERHKSILKDLLNLLIPEHLQQQETVFEKRFNLKYSEPLIRFKVLDEAISQSFFSGLDDLAIPLSQFQQLNLPLKRIIVVENKTSLYTTLTLPDMQNSIAIFGSGYGVLNLKEVHWFKDVELLYWGDIDVHGFEILAQFRSYHAHTSSMLMDRATFDQFFEQDPGQPSKVDVPLQLTEPEKQLYQHLKTNNYRLEQEKVPLAHVNEFFTKFN